jgi:hypothetical protein
MKKKETSRDKIHKERLFPILINFGVSHNDEIVDKIIKYAQRIGRNKLIKP